MGLEEIECSDEMTKGEGVAVRGGVYGVLGNEPASLREPLVFRASERRRRLREAELGRDKDAGVANIKGLRRSVLVLYCFRAQLMIRPTKQTRQTDKP